MHEAFRRWLASLLLDFFDVFRERPFQCPLYRCHRHFCDLWSAYKHGHICPQLVWGWYFCQRCDRFENFLTMQVSSQEPSPSPSSAAQDSQIDLPDPLRSVGDQFSHTGYPAQLDLPDLPSGDNRIPDIIISTSSYESNQTDAAPAAFARRGAPSDGAFGLTKVPAATPKSVKSEGYTSRKARRPTSQDQPTGGESLGVPTNGASDLILCLCRYVHTTNEEWMAVLSNEPDILQQVSAYRIHSIFEAGLRALQKYFRRTSPSTSDFKDLYCLAHVVVASVCTFHRHEVYDWDSLVESLLRWGRIIEDEQERALYQCILWSTWRAQRVSPVVAGDQLRDTRRIRLRALEPCWPASRSLLLDEIKNGKAMSQGVELLDSRSFSRHCCPSRSLTTSPRL